jgi:hypothetical protein
MHESAAMDGPPVVQRLLQSIKDKARLRRAAGTPSDDAAGEGVDDKRNVNKPLPGGHIGEVRALRWPSIGCADGTFRPAPPTARLALKPGIGA